MRGLRIASICMLFVLLGILGIGGSSLAADPQKIPTPYWLKAYVKVDGAQLSGADTSYSIKVTNTSGVDLEPIDTAGNTFGKSIAGRFSYKIPIYDATDQPKGAQTGSKACIAIYKDTTLLTMSYPVQGTCPTGTGEITIGNEGETIGFGGISATTAFTDPLTVTSPKPAITMKYDTTDVASGGTIPFGNVTIGSTPTITLTITNSGDTGTTLHVTGIALGGTDSAKFALSSTAELMIAKGESKTIGITYTPTAAASNTAAITFNSDTGTGGAAVANTLNLTGTGQTEAVSGVSLSGDVSPSGGYTGTVDYGNVEVDAASAEKTITITNNGTYNLVIGAITQSGDAGQFKSTADTCSAKTVSPSSTCNVKGTFNPTSGGTKTATLTFATNRAKSGTEKDNPTDTATVVTLTGKGIKTGFSLTVGSAGDFGTLTLPDTTSKDLTAIIENTGTEILSNFTLSTAGSPFSVLPTTISSLAVGASTNATVTYTATQSKTAHTGTLTVTSGSFSNSSTLTGKTVTRPTTPTNTSPANGATGVALTPTFTSSAFSSSDESTHEGSKWIIYDASASTVYKTQTIDSSGNYVVGYDSKSLTSFALPKGILKYGSDYAWQVVYRDNRAVDASPSTLTTFSTLAKPSGYDDYGNPTNSNEVKDASGNSYTSISAANITSLKNDSTVKSTTPQIGTVSTIITTGSVTDPSGNVILINTTDVKIAKTGGGAGTSMVLASKAGDTITTVQPISTTGKTVDASGNLTQTAIPNLSIPSTISMPYGLFSFNVTVAAAGASTNIVLVPPAPFSSSTKWYKIDSTGVPQVYPNFVVDASGNGILTLTDGGAGDSDPRAGFISDPGGPGGAAGAGGDTGDDSSSSGCFIATAAFGSYFDPYVTILRNFRDLFLMTNRAGQAFVNWYYRVSPPIADFIAKSEGLRASVRIMLLPAVGFSALALHLGMFWTLIIMLAIAGVCIGTGRKLYRHLL